MAGMDVIDSRDHDQFGPPGMKGERGRSRDTAKGFLGHQVGIA